MQSLKSKQCRGLKVVSRSRETFRAYIFYIYAVCRFCIGAF